MGQSIMPRPSRHSSGESGCADPVEDPVPSATTAAPASGAT
ncbi:hypothetical protein ACFYT3_27325 [Nocardia amikacinitolerans]|nr:hypothetical protein [Nocardia amikacinitolerans]